MAIKIYPYKQGSASAKKLAVALDTKVLKLQGSKYKPRQGDLIINWGAGNVPNFGPARILNQHIRLAQNKLDSFKQWKDVGGINIPPFSTTKEEAKKLQFPVMCRTKLGGHSGEGIVIAEKEDELVNAPLYTQYIKKQDEYRVHVMGDQPFFIQRKARKLDNENPDWRVRNLAGGFVFVETPEAEVPINVVNQAVKALKALGLEFGGVDVIWNAKEEKAYVLEINTACGLEERTADHYRDAIRNLI